MNTVEYVIYQDYTREIKRFDNHDDAIDFLEKFAKEYENEYRIRLNKSDDTLTLQDFDTGVILSTLRIKAYDNRVKNGGIFNGFNLAQLSRA